MLCSLIPHSVRPDLLWQTRLQLEQNPGLLTREILTPKRHYYISELSLLLEESKNTPVYTFIQKNLSDPVSILSQWTNDKIVSKGHTLSLSSSYSPDYTYPFVTNDAGVYVWSVGVERKQYIARSLATR